MITAVRSAAGDHVLTGVTRIADFDARPFDVEPSPREAWEDGDYVAGEVVDGAPFLIETPGGRAVEVVIGDGIIGALGRRCATLEVVGDWRVVGPDLRMQTLTSGGVLGRCTSASFPPPRMATLRYAGHVTRDGRPCRMADFARPVSGAPLRCPVVAIIGTSMDAGKTVAATRIIRELKRLGLRVGATKLTGIGRFRDILAASDAGADFVADFVDAGLPSTAVAPEVFSAALDRLLGILADGAPDVVVAEAGASPLEPYNGAVAIRRLGDLRRCTVLCASDPYAVVGVRHAFDIRPDLVSGRATSTDAAIALLRRLDPAPALNLLDPASSPRLRELLAERLGIDAATVT